MMESFVLDKNIIAEALRNPFDGCFDPEKAAWGRAAEPSIVKLTAQKFGLNIEAFDSPKLAKEHRSILGKNKRHDGLIFDGDTLVGVIEAKLALRPEVWIKNEVKIYEYCKYFGFAYIIAIAEMKQLSSLACEVTAVTNLCECPEILNGFKIRIADIKNNNIL